MLKFEVNNQSAIIISPKWLKQVVLIFANSISIKSQKYFSLAFVDQKTIRHLNYYYRGKNQVTDVLSFREDGEDFIKNYGQEKFLGEVVICASQAKKQAQKFSWPFQEEVARLLIHGLAHLIGYEHEGVSKKQAAKMFSFEEKVVAQVRLEKIRY